MTTQRSEPFGRPTLYSEELADRICQVVATHPHGLPKLCKMFDFMPCPETINVWRWQKSDFSDKYTLAKQFQAELMAESSEEVIDELTNYEFSDKDGAIRLDSGVVARARLLIDSRKWHASKLAPKIYGDKSQPEISSTDNLKDVSDKLDKLMAAKQKEY